MEDKIEENELEEEKASIGEKIIEFIAFYLSANVLINIVYYFLFYILSTSIQTNGFSEFVMKNNLINLGVIILDIILICMAVNIFNKLYLKTICEEYKTLESILMYMCIIGGIIGVIISGILNKELNLTGMNVHYVHYILISILIMGTVGKYSKMCKDASLDDFRKKHNITRKTDWI